MQPLDSPAAARTLADHRIAKIEGRQVQDHYPREIGRNARLGSHGRGGACPIRIVTTDQGATGWGLCHAPDDEVAGLVGVPLSDLFDLDHGALPEGERLDLPLHDLAGQILGQPVYALLGSQGPTEVPIYTGAIYFDDLDPEENPRGLDGVLACCRQDYELGYRAFKLKIGRGHKWMPRAEGLQRDIEVTRAVREQYPECRILVDANDGYTCDDLCRYLSAVADCDLFWIEEPFPEGRDDLLRLRDHMRKLDCRALIADGEARREKPGQPGPYGYYSDEQVALLYALAAEGLVDVFLFDLGIVGFTRWRRIMPELEGAGVLASPHAWGLVSKTYYITQLAAGVGNVVIVEGVPGTTEGLDYSAFQFIDDRLRVPDASGFGLSL